MVFPSQGGNDPEEHAAVDKFDIVFSAVGIKGVGSQATGDDKEHKVRLIAFLRDQVSFFISDQFAAPGNGLNVVPVKG